MRAAVILAFAAAVVAVAAPALAEAWPRTPGEVFVSVRGDVERGLEEPDWDGTAYVEYGFTRRITLVARATTADDPSTPSRLGSAARLALGRLDAPNRFAVSLGVSSPPDLTGAMTSTRLEAAAHWGRGFETRLGGGWATATARVFLGRDTARPITDVYGLVGLRPAAGVMTMLSVSRYADDGGVYWKLSPSIGYELRPALWLVPSLTQELNDDRTTAVGLSVWLTF